MQTWLDAVGRALASDYALAVELLRCRRLIKGYSDTHARGARCASTACCAQPRFWPDATAPAPRCARLREAALRDAEGQALDQALRAMQLTA